MSLALLLAAKDELRTEAAGLASDVSTALTEVLGPLNVQWEQDAIAAETKAAQVAAAVQAILNGTPPTFPGGGTAPADGTVLAAENAAFTLDAPAIVSFGADGGYVQASLAAGTYTCSLPTFNSTDDPKPMVAKSCVVGAYAGGGGTIPAVVNWTVKGVVADGDNITSGQGAYTNPWPTVLDTLTGVPVESVAFQGDSLQGRIDSYAAETAIKFDDETFNTLVICAGSIDLLPDARTDAQLRTMIQSYCALARATGFKVCVTTIPPRQSEGWSATQESRRGTYNTWLKLNYSSFADALIDFDAALTLADILPLSMNPTNLGGEKLAAAVKTKLAI